VAATGSAIVGRHHPAGCFPVHPRPLGPAHPPARRIIMRTVSKGGRIWKMPSGPPLPERAGRGWDAGSCSRSGRIWTRLRKYRCQVGSCPDMACPAVTASWCAGGPIGWRWTVLAGRAQVVTSRILASAFTEGQSPANPISI
jgi:hypothetical protein